MIARSAIRGSLWMLAASVCFAAMAALVKVCAKVGVPLAQTVFYRGVVSSLVAMAVMRFQGTPVRTPHWRAHLRRGGIGFVGIVVYFAGVMLLPLSAAVTLNYTSPLLLAGWLLYQGRERPPLALMLALGGGFTGVVLLLQPSYDRSQWLGITAALASAFTAVAAALNIRTLGRLREPAWRTVAWFSFFVTAASLPWFLSSHPAGLSTEGMVAVVAMSLASTLGQALLTLAYQRGHALMVSLLGYSQVVFTVFIGMLVWQDFPPAIAWAGIALIVASGGLATAFMGGVKVGKPPRG